MNEIIETSLITVLPRGRGRPRIVDGRDFNDISHDEQVERWERVRHVLRSMSKHQIDKHFDMTLWLTKAHCGTIGCAAGQCALDPWFNRRGYGVNWALPTKTTLDPEYCFGSSGYRDVFINLYDMSYTDRDGDTAQRKPRAQHRITLRNVNQYLKQLKAQA